MKQEYTREKYNRSDKMEFWDIYDILDNFIPIPPDEIPPTSILREFIGGSSFQY